MGGTIALSVRFSDKTEWRDSCWTGVLPNSLFKPEFYDKAKSEDHVRNILRSVDLQRRLDPPSMWGGWSKLAPTGYGLYVIDYLNGGGILDCNGYTSVESIYSNHDNLEKFLALYDAGLLFGFFYVESKHGRRSLAPVEVAEHVRRARGILHEDDDSGFPVVQAQITLWFQDVAIIPEGQYGKCSEWVTKRGFKLSKAEKAAWLKSIQKEG